MMSLAASSTGLERRKIKCRPTGNPRITRRRGSTDSGLTRHATNRSNSGDFLHLRARHTPDPRLTLPTSTMSQFKPPASRVLIAQRGYTSSKLVRISWRAVQAESTKTQHEEQRRRPHTFENHRDRARRVGTRPG